MQQPDGMGSKRNTTSMSRIPGAENGIASMFGGSEIDIK